MPDITAIKTDKYDILYEDKSIGVLLVTTNHPFLREKKLVSLALSNDFMERYKIKDIPLHHDIFLETADDNNILISLIRDLPGTDFNGYTLKPIVELG